jgi:hypothetical protein
MDKKAESNIAQNQDRLNDENNKAPNRIEVRNMILEAKLDIARWKINLLLALLALLGIILPFVLSLKQEVSVNSAIADMKNSFKELAGKQFRKPKIICRDDRNQLLLNSVFEVEKRDATYFINIHNQGDGLAGPIDVYLYLDKYNQALDSEISSWLREWERKPSEDKSYACKYFVGGCDHISPQDIFSIPIYFPNMSEIYEFKALLKIYYGEPEPITVPFTLKIGKKSDNTKLPSDANQK